MSYVGEGDATFQNKQGDDGNANVKPSHDEIKESVCGDASLTDPHVKLSKMEQYEKAAEETIKRLHMASKAPENQAAMRDEISNLIQIRSDLIPQNRICRRAAWKEEIRKEVEERTEFKNKMEAVPLEDVTDWKDKQAMAKLSVEWREGLKNGRTTFLFHDVFSILEKEYLDTTAMLGCRPVCKTWRDSFDNCFSQPASSSFIPHQAINTASASGSGDRDKPLAIGPLSTPIDNRIQNSSNPFVTRKLQLGSSLIHWKDNVDYWKGVDPYLMRWGRELRSVIFDLERGLSFELKYLHLIKYLGMMPNLRALVIQDEENWNDGDTTRERDLAKDMSSLKERMEGNPFPELPHLHSVVFEKFLPPPLIHSALKAYSGSLEVIFFGMERMTDPCELLEGCDFPKLKFLVSKALFSFTAPCNFSSPSLEGITITTLLYDCVGGDSSIVNLFGALNRCGSQLRHLSLRLDSGSSSLEGTKLSDKVLRSLSLELPHLEELTLVVSDLNLENIDFLLPCSSLKRLKTVCLKTLLSFDEKSSRKDESPLSEIIQFTGYHDHLYDSNIWNLFPQLSRVMAFVYCKLKESQGRESRLRCGSHLTFGNDTDVSGGIYTREEYQGENGAVTIKSSPSRSFQHSLCFTERKQVETIKRLHKAGEATDIKAQKMNQLLKLSQNRSEAILQKRMSHRSAWAETIRKQQKKKEEFMRKMERVPLEDAKDWRDKQVMANVSAEWREALKNERTSFLFYDILSILYQGVHMGLNDLLRCRAACKAWKGGFENCFFNEFRSYSILRNEFGLPYSSRLPVCYFPIKTLKELERFESCWIQAYPDLNPFLIARRADIGKQGTLWIENMPYWRGVEPYLHHWGHGIWYLRFGGDKGMSFQLKYLHLIKYLVMVPNLRKLTLLDKNNWTATLEATMYKDLNQCEFGPLIKLVKDKPFPDLPHLHSITFDTYVLPPIIMGALKKYGGSLTNLAFSAKETDPSQFVAACDLPRLKTLIIFSFSTVANSYRLNCPNLEELELTYYEVGGEVSIRSLFQTINSCGSSLKRLRLQLHNKYGGLPGKTIKLEEGFLRGLFLGLPHLQTLKLDIYRIGLKNLDFLLPCESLKELDLEYQKLVPTLGGETRDQGRRRPVQNEIIQFTEYTNRLYESNLWELFPRLQLVTIVIIYSLDFGKCEGREPVIKIGSKRYAGKECRIMKGRTPLCDDMEMRVMIYTRDGYRKKNASAKMATDVGGPN